MRYGMCDPLFLCSIKMGVSHPSVVVVVAWKQSECLCFGSNFYELPADKCDVIESRIAASSCFRSQLHLQRKNILQPKQNPIEIIHCQRSTFSSFVRSGCHKPFTNACVNYGHGIVAADGGVVHSPIAPKMARSLINGLCRLPSVFHAPLPPATTTTHSRSRCVENFAFKYGNFPPLTPPSASSCRSSPLPSSLCDRHDKFGSIDTCGCGISLPIRNDPRPPHS